MKKRIVILCQILVVLIILLSISIFATSNESTEITISNVDCNKNDDINIRIYIPLKNIKEFKLVFECDEPISFIDASSTTLFCENGNVNIDNGEIQLYWITETEVNNTLRISIKLNISNSAIIGNTYKIKLKDEESFIKDFGDNSIIINCNEASLNVIPKIGDINFDGYVDIKDAQDLMRYLSKIILNMDTTNCDVNNDGSINNKDVTRIWSMIDKNEYQSNKTHVHFYSDIIPTNELEHTLCCEDGDAFIIENHVWTTEIVKKPTQYGTGLEKTICKYCGYEKEKILSVLRTFTVTFYYLEKNGIVYAFVSQPVVEGESAIPPTIPDVEGLVFIGWNQPLDNIQKNLDISAIYENEKYNVKFIDEDNNLIEEQEVEYGFIPNYPTPPEKEGFKFDHWSNYGSIYEDSTIIAIYTRNEYTVEFGADGYYFEIKYVYHGDDVIAPIPPEIEGHTFVGWNKPLTNITSDITIEAIYEINKYKVRFLLEDGTLIKEETVEYTYNATAPNPPRKEGYIFVNWDKGFYYIDDDLDVTAIYEKELYEIAFFIFGQYYKSDFCFYGESATVSTPDYYGYDFVGWDKPLDNIKGNMTVNAIMERSYYSVKFLDYDGTVIKEENVEYGKSATPPDEPTRLGYVFTNWDSSFDSIYNNKEIRAKYTKVKYKVRFYDYFGNIIGTSKYYYYDEIVTAPILNENGYIFKGWDKDFSVISADMDIYPTYDLQEYDVIFKDYDGTILKTEKVKFGKDATLPTNPNREGYNFECWDGFYTHITYDTEITATYQRETCDVKFYKNNGDVLFWTWAYYGDSVTAPNAPDIEGYIFRGWNESFDVVKEDLNIYPIYEKLCVVTFLNYDETVIKQMYVEKGKSAVLPNSPKREGYTFTGWSEDHTNITGDTEIKALFDINIYTVKFVDYDNSEIKTEKVPYMQSATPPQSPEREGYSFKGWLGNYSKIVCDVTFSATYSIKKYLARFLVDGKSYSEFGYYDYGTTIKAPSNPNKIGYTFIGWDKEFSTLKENIDINAIFAKNYTITFKKNGNVLKTEVVYEGQDATPPKIEQEYGYIFKGWDDDYTNIKEDLEINAIIEREEYTITFIDYDGTVLSQQRVKYIDFAETPPSPTRKGYQFIEWENYYNYHTVTKDATYYAKYEICTYYVEFYLVYGDNIEYVTYRDVEYGKSITDLPYHKEIEGYTFTNWDKDLSFIESDMSVYGIYKTNEYLVQFKDHLGNVIKSQKIPYAGSVEPPQISNRQGYRFDGWSAKSDCVKSDLVITPVYTKLYKVVFLNQYGIEIKKEYLEYGSDATPPNIPEKEGYTFIGWDKIYSYVEEDLIISPVYTKNSYWVYFVDYDNTIIKSVKVEYGNNATPPNNPVIEGHDFIGWDGDFTNIKSDTWIYAKYNINSYIVTFVDYDGKVISKQSVSYEELPSIPNDPSRVGYDFTGWDKEITYITEDTTFTAQYEVITLSVYFYDADYNILSKVNVEYGGDVVYDIIPEKEGYTFVGWDKELTNIQNYLYVYPVYEINKYLVQFLDYDGSIISEQYVEYDKSATVPNSPSRYGYTFDKWDKSYNFIKSDLIVNAIYNKNVYQVIFRGKDNKEIDVQYVPYGESAIEPEHPNYLGYTFNSWDKSFDNITESIIVKAIYDVNKYKITYVDYDDTIIDVVYGYFGYYAPVIDNPTREGYTFTGWDRTIGYINYELGDVIVKAQYKINEYTVEFYDGFRYISQKVKYKESAIPPEPANILGYHFIGWDKSYDNITSSIIVTAIFEKDLYTVKFVDYDGTVIDTQIVEYGSKIVIPSSPTRENYTFIGWDKNTNDSIFEDKVFNAQYEIIKHLVTFFTYKNAIAWQGYVDQGSSAVAPEPIAREGYVFKGWDKDFSNVTSNLTINPIYEKIEFKVRFYDDNDDLIEEVITKWGENAKAPNIIPNESKIFSYWDGTFENVKSDLNIKAVYKYSIKYIVDDEIFRVSWAYKNDYISDQPIPDEKIGYDFVGWSKNDFYVTQPEIIYANYKIKQLVVTFKIENNGYTYDYKVYVEYGKKVMPCDIVPERNKYNFVGWYFDFDQAITDNMDIYPIFELKQYKVTFVDYDGSVLGEYIVDIESYSPVPESPSRVGYKFTGWDGNIYNITSDTTIYAKYDINVYKVTFTNFDYNDIMTEYVEYGKSATAPELEKIVDDYIFVGWDKDFSNITEDTVVNCIYVPLYYAPTIILEEEPFYISNDNFYIKIRIKNNPGIASLVFSLEYDPRLIITDIRYNTSHFGDNFVEMESYDMNPALIYYLSLYNVDSDYDIVYITFTKNGSFEPNEILNFNITYNPDDIYNQNEENVTVNIDIKEILAN